MASHRTTIDDSIAHDPQSALLPDLMENPIAHIDLSTQALAEKKKDEFISVLALNLTEKLKSDMAELDAVQSALNKARASIAASLETTKSLSELVTLVRQESWEERTVERAFSVDQDINYSAVPVRGDTPPLSEAFFETINGLSQRSHSLTGSTHEAQSEYAKLKNLLSKQHSDFVSDKSSTEWSEKSILELFK